MKKINQIQIGSHTFFFDEEAVGTMERYIARIKELYKDNGEELKVNDVETRIADFCYNKAGENGIVSASIIEEAIGAIGIDLDTPITSEEASNDKETKNESTDDADTPWYKAMQLGNKLFLNPHDGFIGGVLAGLAGYLGINVALLRILTIILFIIEPVGGLVYIAYILLWIILPKAKTIIDYARMNHVKKSGDTEADKKAWKNNYEQAIQQLATPPASGCLPMLVKAIFFLPLVPLIILVAVFLVAIIVLPLSFIYLFIMGSHVGIITLPLIVLAISLVTAFAVLVFAIISWLLRKSRTCKPMSRWAKITLTTLFLVSLLFAGTAIYKMNFKSYDNVKEIIQTGFKNIFNGTITTRQGSFYNNHPIDTSDDNLYAAIWDSELQSCNIPFVVETVHDEKGEYNVYFYHHEGRVEEIEFKVADKEYDARYTLNTDMLHGYLYFIWDEANDTLYIDEEYNAPESIRNSTFENRTNAIKIGYVHSGERFNFCNATEKGLATLSLFFYGEQRVPSLLVGGDDENVGIEIPPVSSYKCIKSFQIPQRATRIDENGEKDTVVLNTNINIDEDKLQRAIDDVKKLGDATDKIIKNTHDIVKIRATEK